MMQNGHIRPSAPKPGQHILCARAELTQPYWELPDLMYWS